MSHSRSRTVSAALFLVLAAVVRTSASGAADDRSFTFRVDTPAVVTVPAENGLSEIRVSGFRTHLAGIGAPDVPTRTVLVAIPPGATPRLSVRTAGEAGFRPVVPRPVGRAVTVTPTEPLRGRPGSAEALAPARRVERRIYEPDPRLYEGRGTVPARAAWLGEIGVLRHQRYVEVHLAPVRYDTERGGLVVESGLELTVHFDGEIGTGGEPAAEDPFEGVYRSTFENYAQGRRFRIVAPEEPDTASSKGRAPSSSSGPLRRIRVRQNGPVRLDHALFDSAAPEFLSTDPRTWRLANRGEQVALRVVQGPGDDALLEPGEWVQFYGQALDGEPATELNYEKPANPIENLFAVRDFTDENVYFLSVETAAQPIMAEREATAPAGPAEPWFTDVARAEIDNLFLPLPEELWFWTPFTNETSGPRPEAVALPGLASGILPARFRVRLRGFLDCPGVDPDHVTSVTVENASAEPLVLPVDNPANVGSQNVGEHDGNDLFVHDFDWHHSPGEPELTDPVSVVLDAPEVAGSCPTGGNLLNENLLDAVEVEYARSFNAVGDRLTFDYPDGDAIFEIAGFSGPDVEVYEITGRIGTSDVVEAVRLTGVVTTPVTTRRGTTYTARFRVDDDPGLDGATARRFAAAGPGGVSIPAPGDFQADRESTLASDTTQADLVVIAHPDLLESACSEGGNPCSYDVECVASPTDRCEVAAGSELDDLLALRAQQGITSRVARIQDVEDEFAHGLAGPDAIREFLAWTLGGGWETPAPAYVLLVGDGSLDYKGGTAAGNFVPTQVMVKYSEILAHYPSDSRLAAVAGDDQLADLVVGRITAREAQEAADVLAKILDYESTAVYEPWRSSALLISDRGKNYKASEALGFEAMNDLGASFLDGTSYSTTKLRYWTDNCGGVPGGCDAGVMKQDIKDHVNGYAGPGAAVVQFTGHGNFDIWSDDVFFCANENYFACSADDTMDLTNQWKLPVLFVHNCLTGGFHGLALKSFGEQWLKWPLGGAVAVYAPSGLGFQFIGTTVTEIIWGDIFGPRKERVLAVPVLDSQVQLCAQGSIEPCQYYTLLGDPALRLQLPHVGPPTSVTATASSGAEPFVDLSWNASATVGARYDVYRTKQLNQPYAKVNDAPIDTTSFTDEDVQHTLTYYYYVVATDQGFDSAWSNFNSDCGATPGPDCVQAQPLNLDPPAAPVGLTATDAETGGRLDLSWVPNAEVDIWSYEVHYGTTPSYGSTKTVLGDHETSLTGLQDGATYYVAIQATNTSGTASPLSDPPVTAVPTMVLGVKAPDWISDLRLAKSSSDALLSWTPVTHDIYGKPVAVAHYEILRGVAPVFLPTPEPPHDTTSTAGYSDAGSLAAAEDHFYLVRAVDAEGNPGGLGHQLPAGVVDLEIEPSATTPGALVLGWSPVGTDFDGNPLIVAHYEIWAAAAPFTRAEIEAGMPELVSTGVTSTTVEIFPAGPKRYYSVLAVDARGNRSPF